MLAAGMFQPAPSFGLLNTMLEGSKEGRDLLHALYVSGHDLALEWFEDAHTINMVDRLGSENMMDPRVDGSGVNLLMLVPFMHLFGIGLAKGGSGSLAATLVRSIEARGGTIRTNAHMTRCGTFWA